LHYANQMTPNGGISSPRAGLSTDVEWLIEVISLALILGQLDSSTVATNWSCAFYYWKVITVLRWTKRETGVLNGVKSLAVWTHVWAYQAVLMGVSHLFWLKVG